MERTARPPPVWTYSCNKTARLPKSSIKPLRGLIISNTFQGGGGLIWERGLFNLTKTMVSTRMQSGKVQVQEVGSHVAEDRKQLQTSS